MIRLARTPAYSAAGLTNRQLPKGLMPTTMGAAALIFMLLPACRSVSSRDRSILTELVRIRKTGQPLRLFKSRGENLSIADAYRIQNLLVHKLKTNGESVAGYKVAFTSKPAQEAFQVTEPAYGRLFESMAIQNGAEVMLDDFIVPFVEVEVAFIIGRRIDRAITNIDEVKQHVRSVHAAFDIPNNRFDPNQGRPTVVDIVMDNAGAHRFVLGKPFDPAEVDVEKVVARLIVNGQEISKVPATAAMGSPWNVLKWLANSLIERGFALEAGDVVLTGALGKPYRVAGQIARVSFVGDCGRLGKVSCEMK